MVILIIIKNLFYLQTACRNILKDYASRKKHYFLIEETISVTEHRKKKKKTCKKQRYYVAGVNSAYPEVKCDLESQFCNEVI